MKKSAVIVIAALLIVCCMAGFTACSKKSDWEYIGDKGTLVVGVTDYKPMDYQNGDGSWTGFDAEAARLVGAALGLKVEFIEISWDEKITELKSKKIDVIWNGMTVTDELKENMDFSYSYAQNSQVAVIKKSDAAIYTSIETIKNAGVKIAVESGSAGETAAKENFSNDNIVSVGSQVNALLEINAGTSKVAFIDYTMANSLCGAGSYSDLTVINGISLSKEEFAVGIRQGSELVGKINEQLVALYKNGKLQELATQFGTQEGQDGCSIALCDLSAK